MVRDPLHDRTPLDVSNNPRQKVLVDYLFDKSRNASKVRVVDEPDVYITTELATNLVDKARSRNIEVGGLFGFYLGIPSEQYKVMLISYERPAQVIVPSPVAPRVSLDIFSHMTREGRSTESPDLKCLGWYRTIGSIEGIGQFDEYIHKTFFTDEDNAFLLVGRNIGGIATYMGRDLRPNQRLRMVPTRELEALIQ